MAVRDADTRLGSKTPVRQVPSPQPLLLRLAGGGLTPAASIWLWVLVVAVGDLTLTYQGLQIGFVELNPLGRLGLAVFGGSSLAAGKLLALGVGVVSWRLLDRHRMLVPTTFLLVWGWAMLSNAVLLLN